MHNKSVTLEKQERCYNKRENCITFESSYYMAIVAKAASRLNGCQESPYYTPDLVPYLNAQLSFSSGQPLDVTSIASRNSLKSM